MDGMLGRWALQIQEYNFTISHVKGMDNILADSLSRQVAATSASACIPDRILIEKQESDPILASVKECIEKETELSLPSTMTSSLRKRWKQLFPQIKIQDGILVRIFTRNPFDEITSFSCNT